MRYRNPAMATPVKPSGRETFFSASEMILSKTDLKGRITYANGLFCKMAGYREAELIGQPHSIIRHPDMPRAFSACCGTPSKTAARSLPSSRTWPGTAITIGSLPCDAVINVRAR